MDFETKYAISGGVLCMFTIFYHKAYSKGICRFRNSDNEDLKKTTQIKPQSAPTSIANQPSIGSSPLLTLIHVLSR